MKSFRRLTALVLAFGMMSTASQMCSAAVFGSAYNKTYIENFDDETKIFGEDGIFEAVQNVSEDTVSVVESNQGGEYLEVVSGGADIQIRTKKGVFCHDVTVIDMTMSSVFGTSPFPLMRLFNNGTRMDPGNGLFRFVNNNKQIRSYNQVTNSYDVVEINNDWVNVRIILDSINSTITTSFNGSQTTTVSEMTGDWNNEDIQLFFQVAANSKLRLDDVVVSNGAYAENLYMVQDFEHSATVNEAVNNGFFYNINKTQNPVVTYDEDAKNTYLDITNASGNLIYTAWTIDTINAPAVVEFDMKADSATGTGASLKRNANKAVTPLFADSEIVADGKFHSYRATVFPCEAGYKVVRFVDDTALGNNELDVNAYCGNDARLEITAGAASSNIAIDNLKVYYPQEPQLSCNLDGRNDVYVASTIELFSNTPFDVNTAEDVIITADGENVTFDVTPNAKTNSLVYEIDGGLDYETEYVITTNGLADKFGQEYNETIVFETAEKVVLSEGFITCKINGAEVPDDTLVNGAMEIIFSVRANTEAGTTATGVLEQYDASGELIREDSFTVTVDGIGEKFQRAGLEITDDIESVKMVITSEDEEIDVVTELVK